MELSESSLNIGRPLQEGDYYEMPTFGETVTAQIDSYKAVGMLESDMFNYNEERRNSIDNIKNMDIDENSKAIYTRVMETPRNVLQKLEDLYEKGDIERIRNWNEFGTGEDFLSLKDIQKSFFIPGPKDIEKTSNDKALTRYKEAQDILLKSDSTSGKIVGAMAGFFQSPSNVATLPIGTWKAGSGILFNAIRAFGEEAAIEAGLQIASQPQIHSYKNEIGIKTSIEDSVVEALVNIGAAGTIRMTGSMAFDVGEAGLKALSKSDPDLAESYSIIKSRDITDDFREHAENMDKVEIGETPVIKYPNEKAQEIMNEPAYKEFEDYAPDINPEKVEVPNELKIGTDAEGNDIVIKYDESIKIEDDNLKRYNDAINCMMGSK